MRRHARDSHHNATRHWPVVERSQALAQLIDRTAAPAWAGVAVERLRESNPDAAAQLDVDTELAEAFVTVTSASRSLTELCIAEPAALDVLGDLGTRRPVEAGDVGSLRRWKRLELL